MRDGVNQSLAHWYPNSCRRHVGGQQVETLNSAIPTSNLAPGTPAITEILVTGEKSGCTVDIFRVTFILFVIFVYLHRKQKPSQARPECQYNIAQETKSSQDDLQW